MAIKKMSKWGLTQSYPDRENLRQFMQREEVAGLYHRKDDFLKFANCREPYLEFEREPQNPHDKNAIKVMGKSKGLFGTKIYFLGYVSAELAKRIVEGGYYGRVFPEISGMQISEDGEFVHLYYNLLGPKGGKKAFHGK